MYLLRAKEKVDNEVRTKERERKKRERQERKERKKIDSYDSLVQGWQDITFNCGYLGSFVVRIFLLPHDTCAHTKHNKQPAQYNFLTYSHTHARTYTHSQHTHTCAHARAHTHIACHAAVDVG
jgi:hypothetical protein